MMRSSPEMPQYLILAIDHHERLLEEAKHQRQRMIACSSLERPLRWRRLRVRLGELLIQMGRRLKTGTSDATDTVWG